MTNSSRYSTLLSAQSRLRVLGASKRQAFPSPGLFVLNYRHHVVAARCCATATHPVRTLYKTCFFIHHADSRSSTPPRQAIGYNRKQVSSFNRFLDSSFDFKKNSSLTSPGMAILPKVTRSYQWSQTKLEDPR